MFVAAGARTPVDVKLRSSGHPGRAGRHTEAVATRADSRTQVRQHAPGLGDLRNDFDFSQKPRPPLILPGGVEPPYRVVGRR
jgi:hypothetical protein